MSNTPKSNGKDEDQSGEMAVVLEAIQRSNDLAENLGQAGNDFRSALNWDTEGEESLQPELVSKHLGTYEKEIGSYLDDIGRLMEILPAADEIAMLSVKAHIPPDLTVLNALDGHLVPADETIETIADWANSIDDDLDVLYAESLFTHLLLSQPGVNAPLTAMLQEKIAGLFDAVMPTRDKLSQVLEYFE